MVTNDRKSKGEDLRHANGEEQCHRSLDVVVGAASVAACVLIILMSSKVSGNDSP